MPRESDPAIESDLTGLPASLPATHPTAPQSRQSSSRSSPVRPTRRADGVFLVCPPSVVVTQCAQHAMPSARSSAGQARPGPTWSRLSSATAPCGTSILSIGSFLTAPHLVSLPPPAHRCSGPNAAFFSAPAQADGRGVLWFRPFQLWTGINDWRVFVPAEDPVVCLPPLAAHSSASRRRNGYVILCSGDTAGVRACFLLHRSAEDGLLPPRARLNQHAVFLRARSRPHNDCARRRSLYCDAPRPPCHGSVHSSPSQSLFQARNSCSTPSTAACGSKRPSLGRSLSAPSPASCGSTSHPTGSALRRPSKTQPRQVLVASDSEGYVRVLVEPWSARRVTSFNRRQVEHVDPDLQPHCPRIGAPSLVAFCAL